MDAAVSCRRKNLGITFSPPFGPLFLSPPPDSWLQCLVATVPSSLPSVARADEPDPGAAGGLPLVAPAALRGCPEQQECKGKGRCNLG